MLDLHKKPHHNDESAIKKSLFFYANTMNQVNQKFKILRSDMKQFSLNIIV